MTTTQWIDLLLCVSIIGCAMVAGFFLTFSDFLMRSLRLASTTSGIEVMQVINREVLRSVTIGLLWGMLALSTALTGAACASHLPDAAVVLIATGTALYFFGVLVVSFAFNLRLNARLDGMDPHAPASARYWESTYLPQWVLWNTVRAVTSAGASVCFLSASLLLA